MIRLKIVLLGDMAVGKTSYMLQLVNKKFFNYMDSTIGAAFSTKLMEIDNKQVKIEFWDTAGQERYRSLISMYYNNADAALIFYDINRIDTLDSAIKLIDTLKKRGPINIQYILIGNKYDMIDDSSISIEIVNNKLKQSDNENVVHIYTSAKIDYNIEYSIERLIKCIKLEYKEKNNQIDIKNIQKNSTNCCKY
uniref:Ras family protein n=1 Tax=Megaviridae environmental sample TaxID=1737588 RepID=A0A5J6VMZ5_9VIRU|nr:MAG: Ras family protein [Megaviridae environmental sample]